MKIPSILCLFRTIQSQASEILCFTPNFLGGVLAKWIFVEKCS